MGTLKQNGFFFNGLLNNKANVLVISLIMIGIFNIDQMLCTDWIYGPISVNFQFNPHKKYLVWRYVTYMFVHKQ